MMASHMQWNISFGTQCKSVERSDVICVLWILVWDQIVVMPRWRGVLKVFRGRSDYWWLLRSRLQVIELSYYLPGETFSSAHL